MSQRNMSSGRLSVHHLSDYFKFWGGRRWGCNELTGCALLCFGSCHDPYTQFRALALKPCVHNVQWPVHCTVQEAHLARVTHLMPVLSFLLRVNQWTRARFCSEMTEWKWESGYHSSIFVIWTLVIIWKRRYICKRLKHYSLSTWTLQVFILGLVYNSDLENNEA